jgi:uncharacterized protein with HEPN domain
MPNSPLEYLRHILDEIEYLIKENQELSKERFLRDKTFKRAYVRSLETVGEASKKILPKMRSRHSDVLWGAIAGMRGRLIHDCFGSDDEIVWDIVADKISALHDKIAINQESSG